MEFNLRKLQSTDLFSMMKIISKIGIENIKNAVDVEKIKSAKSNMTEENSSKIATDIGMEIMMGIFAVVLERLPIVEDELYAFMGSVSGMKPKDVAKLGINDFMALMIEIFQKEEFKDFFNRALRLTKSV